MNRISALLATSMVWALAWAPAPAARGADIVIGVPNRLSAVATAHVIKVVLEQNLDLEVELQAAVSPRLFEAMSRGDMQVHPEVWLPNEQALHERYVTRERSVVANPNGVTVEQGMCVTRAVSEKHGVTAITDLADPKTARLFDTDDDGLGEVWIGSAQWASTNVERIRARSYGYAETMTLLEMDQKQALAAVDEAVAERRPVVFFCQAPHFVFAMHDLVMLEEPPHSPAKWNVVRPADDADWLAKSSAAVGWDKARLHIHFARTLEATHPEAARMLSKMQLDTQALSQMIYALEVERQPPVVVARQWVASHEDLVAQWLK